jgi:hypothetical protein
MSEKSRKLATRKQWVIAITAAVAGASLSLYREYRNTGSVRSSSILVAAIVFLFALALMAAIFRYANRPKPEEKR